MFRKWSRAFHCLCSFSTVCTSLPSSASLMSCVMYDYKIVIIIMVALVGWLRCVDKIVYIWFMAWVQSKWICFQIITIYHFIWYSLLSLILSHIHLFVSCFVFHTFITLSLIFPFLLLLRSALNMKFIFETIYSNICDSTCFVTASVCWTHGYCFTAC